MADIPLALYAHFPWCVKKCPYCDFNSHALRGEVPEREYVDALIKDLEFELSLTPDPRPLTSVFFGGGTPVLDLEYTEDVQAGTDMNVVMNEAGGFVEVQGTAEQSAFQRQELDAMLDLAAHGIRQLIEAQRKALGA